MTEKKINPYDRMRGAVDIPLTPQGHQQVAALGDNFRKNGPLDLVVSADLKRTRDTAHAVSNGAPVLESPHLRDMDYGIFTGMPSHKAIPIINKAMQKDPSRPLPGSSESYDQYQDRIKNMMRLAIKASAAFPEARIGMAVNRRTIKYVEGWLHNGKTDNVVNEQKVFELGEKLEPGDVFKITGQKEGDYGLQKVDSSKSMGPGVYLIRHGLTAWNGESFENKDGKS